MNVMYTILSLQLHGSLLCCYAERGVRIILNMLFDLLRGSLLITKTMKNATLDTLVMHIHRDKLNKSQ